MQIAFTISAFRRPGKMPESLAALGLVQSAASTFAWSVYEMVSRTQNIEEQLEAVRGVYELAEIPNLVPDGTLSFPEKGKSIEAGIALEFRSVPWPSFRKSQVLIYKHLETCLSSTLTRKTTLCATSRSVSFLDSSA